MSLTVDRSPSAEAPAPSYISGPVSDFLLLGGATLLVFPLLLIIPSGFIKPGLIPAAFVLTQFLNVPHFAVSYRIFYEGFSRKLSEIGANDPKLRYRYLFAGVVAPAIILVGLVAPLLMRAPGAMSYWWNLMAFFVGWHYVKQGYGMAMVDSALKKQFWSASEKKTMLINSYSVWITGWIVSTYVLDREEFAGVALTHLQVPIGFLWLSIAIMAATTFATAKVLWTRFRSGTPTAWSGVSGYLVALYAWWVLMQISYVAVLLAPLLHSLQYLFVVRRFQTNRHKSNPETRGWKAQYGLSLLLGLTLFWILPISLNLALDLDSDLFGAKPFTFVIVVFVNIHHYFLDNVMWRRGNPEVSKHLFAASS